MPHITFHTDAKSAFCPADGFDEIPTSELETLLRQIRANTTSLESELMNRQPKRKSDQPGELGRFCERLHSTARELNVRERLDRTAANNVDDAIEILISSESDPRSRIYQAFLYDVLHHCNTGLTLLCAASLGRKKILHLGTNDRVSLLAYVRDAKRTLDSSILTALANDYNVPSLDSPQLMHLKTWPRKRGKTTDDSVNRSGMGSERVSAQAFLQSAGSVIRASEPTSNVPEQREKRKRIGNELEVFSAHGEQRGHVSQLNTDAASDPIESCDRSPTAGDNSSPSEENREMKHMCTNALVRSVTELPEPLRKAVYNSRLWKWERAQGMETTGCLATLFPKDNKQDVSFTIWCGYNDGHYLSNIFGLQLAVSS